MITLSYYINDDRKLIPIYLTNYPANVRILLDYDNSRILIPEYVFKRIFQKKEFPYLYDSINSYVKYDGRIRVIGELELKEADGSITSLLVDSIDYMELFHSLDSKSKSHFISELDQTYSYTTRFKFGDKTCIQYVPIADESTGELFVFHVSLKNFIENYLILGYPLMLNDVVNIYFKTLNVDINVFPFHYLIYTKRNLSTKNYDDLYSKISVFATNLDKLFPIRDKYSNVFEIEVNILPHVSFEEF